MTHADAKVLACVDRSPYADTVADYAAWAALRLDAPLEFLHVIDRHPEIGSGADRSGAIGLGAQENLLADLSAQDAARALALREEGRVFLNRLRERALAAGIMEPDTRQRHGELAQTLEEQQEQVGLVVLGRRGASAQADQTGLGHNLERAVRALRRPVLTVTEGFRAPSRALLAFDGSGVTRRGVGMVAASPLFRGLSIHLLMSGQGGRESARQLEHATQTLRDAGLAAESTLRQGEAAVEIANSVREQGIDLLIMGAYAHSPLRSLLFGSKTSLLLETATIPTLLLR